MSLSAAAYGADYLEHVAVADLMPAELAAREDFAVYLHRDPAVYVHPAEEVGDRRRPLQGFEFTVDSYLHL